MMRALLAAPAAAVLVSCAGGLQSMAYPVDCGATTLRDLDTRLTNAMYDMHVAGTCATQYGVDNFTECPAYHAEWRRYWAARRELDACAVDGVRS
jgi:hypothetical protein